MSDLNVLSVASEVFPLIKTGGLADVAGALPGALKAHGIAVKTLMPGYSAVTQKLNKGTVVHRWADLFGGEAQLIQVRLDELDLLVLDAPHLYRRPGNPYVDANGKDWPDNAERFAALSLVAAEIGRGDLVVAKPDLIHVHDWQGALTPAYLRFGDAEHAGRASPPIVLTIHNLAFQGQYPVQYLGRLKVSPRAFTIDGLEYYGQIGFLKGGIALADHITTVSPTYAAEIQTAEMGMGLDGLLRHRAAHLTGILNGIDETVWNPATDPQLVEKYDVKKLAARKKNKLALQARFGLEERADAPLLTVVSRLTWQKGMDLLLTALPRLAAEGAQLALLGSGDAQLEAAYKAAASDHPGAIGAVIGYDEELSHLAQGGADAILVPSRFEPCGLTQLYALRYGAVPVVARVGGLADTVIDANEMAIAAGVATGVKFAPVTAEALGMGLNRLLALYRDPAAWRVMQQRGMATDVSWRRPALHYAELYRSLVTARQT